MKNLKGWLLLALVFLAGFTGGVVVTRGAVRHFVRNAMVNPDLVRNKIERDLNRKLRLNVHQREQVHQILVGSHRRLRELRREFQPQFAAIVESTRKDVAALLTPEQQEQFEQFQNENRALLRSPRVND